MQVKVLQVHPAGSVAKVRVQSEEFGMSLNVELSLDRYSELRPTAGEFLFASPRKIRVFSPTSDDYSI
jgi:sulfate transport system ATP-binding protein